MSAPRCACLSLGECTCYETIADCLFDALDDPRVCQNTAVDCKRENRLGTITKCVLSRDALNVGVCVSGTGFNLEGLN